MAYWRAERAGSKADYLKMRAHEAMPRWAMDRFIIPWDGPRNLTLSNISPATVQKGAHSSVLGGSHWLQRTVLEFASARYVALVPVAVITMATSQHGRVLSAVSCPWRCDLVSVG